MAEFTTNNPLLRAVTVKHTGPTGDALLVESNAGAAVQAIVNNGTAVKAGVVTGGSGRCFDGDGGKVCT